MENKKSKKEVSVGDAAATMAKAIRFGQLYGMGTRKLNDLELHVYKSRTVLEGKQIEIDEPDNAVQEWLRS